MHIIQLETREPGVFNDHKADHITEPPKGWAMIPPDMKLPSTFPRLGSISTQEIDYPYEVEEKNENGEMVKVIKHKKILTITHMTEGTLPPPVIPEPTEQEILRADVDYILAMM